MSQISDDKNTQKEITFIGAIRDPFCMHPSRDPRVFRMRVEGIDIEKAKEMRKIIQEHIPE